MNALAYLLLRQWKGAVLNMLRSGARTLMGLLALAWIASQFFQGLFFYRQLPPDRIPFHAALPHAALQGIVLFLLAVPGYSVVMRGLSGDLVTFTAGDVDFLFAMPLPQRTVLGFRLGIDAARLLGLTFLGSLWLSPIVSTFLGTPLVPLLTRAVPALFLCFLFLQNATHALYILYAYRVRASEWLARAVKLFGVAAAVSIVLILASDAAQGRTPWEEAARIFAHPIVRTALLPLSLAADATLSANPAFPQLAGPNLCMLLGLALLGVIAVLGQRENVYEPSLAGSLKRARMRDALRTGGFSALRLETLRERQSRQAVAGIQVPQFGTGWLALLWKSAQIGLRSPWAFVIGYLLVGLGIPMALAYYLRPEDRPIIGLIPLAWAYLIFIVGVTAMQRVRNELTQGAFLKALPIAPWKIVAAIVVPSLAGCVATMWTFLLACALLFHDQPQPLLLPVAIVGPLLLSALALYHAVVAILYPRLRDPVHRLMGSLIMLPGWALLLLAPIGTAIAVSAVTMEHGGSLQTQSRLLTAVTAGLATVYFSACVLLLWWASAAFRAYSPADEG